MFLSYKINQRADNMANMANTQLDLADKRLFKEVVGDRTDKPIKIFETHLSKVALCGDFAFKVKKSVMLGPPFTNQTLLTERKRLLEEELRRNRSKFKAEYL